ncbi:MAG TPA: hypothetical protein VMR45_00460 [Patescibacteria group bacterium]|nr:hypothetical protein [Patescibacteria group bacterium]
MPANLTPEILITNPIKQINQAQLDNSAAAWMKQVDKKQYLDIAGCVLTSDLALFAFAPAVLESVKPSLHALLPNAIVAIVLYVLISTVFVLGILWLVIYLLSQPKTVAGQAQQTAFPATRPPLNGKGHEPGFLCLMPDGLAWGLYNKKTRLVEIDKQWSYKKIAKITFVKQTLYYIYVSLTLDDGSQKIFRVNNAAKFKEALRAVNS